MADPESAVLPIKLSPTASTEAYHKGCGLTSPPHPPVGKGNDSRAALLYSSESQASLIRRIDSALPRISIVSNVGGETR